MVQSAAVSVEAYLAELPEERRRVLSAVRDAVRRNMPKGYEETVGWGMISYVVPLETYPETYNGQALCYVGLAAQKNHFALYLTGAYMDPTQEAILREAYEKAGKKPDMGKSCLRFRKAEDLPLDAIARVIASMPPDAYIRAYEEIRARTTKRRK